MAHETIAERRLLEENRALRVVLAQKRDQIAALSALLLAIANAADRLVPFSAFAQTIRQSIPPSP